MPEETRRPRQQYNPDRDHYNSLQVMFDIGGVRLANAEIGPNVPADKYKDIKRQISRRYHPDATDSPEWFGDFMGIMEVLCDEDKKRDYDDLRNSYLRTEERSEDSRDERSANEAGYWDAVDPEPPSVDPREARRTARGTPDGAVPGSVRRSNSGVHVNINGVDYSDFFGSDGNINISGMHIGNDNRSSSGINNNYDVSRSVHIRQNMGDINLGIVNGRQVRVDGSASRDPYIRGGVLYVKNLSGTVYLPWGADLTLDAKTDMGDVRGDVKHPGKIKSNMGNIKLDICSDMRVETKSNMGSIHVRGSPRGQSNRNLYLKTNMGSIDVNYVSLRR